MSTLVSYPCLTFHALLICYQRNIVFFLLSYQELDERIYSTVILCYYVWTLLFYSKKLHEVALSWRQLA